MDLFHEGFITDPQKSLKETCDFLNVMSPKNYLEACATLVKYCPYKDRWSVD